MLVGSEQGSFFQAQGQLRMLSSLGISSPLLLICILLPTPALISKSLAPPAPHLRITWNERRAEGKEKERRRGEAAPGPRGRSVLSSLCGLMEIKKRYSSPVLALFSEVRIEG